MHTLTLYTTEGCHLCETAQQLLWQLREGGIALDWAAVDIALDDALFARYGWSIPVLRRDDGRELGWPFDSVALLDFLGADQP